MRSSWFLGWAGLVVLGMTARAELVLSTIAREGSVLPGGLAGETYTIQSLGEARGLLDGKVYFWARAVSSIAIAGTKEGIWSYQGGAYTLELLEGEAVVGGVAGLRIGKFDVNVDGDVIKNFTLNPSGAMLLSVRLRAGDTNANNDRAIIYRKAGVNRLLLRAGIVDSSFSTGVSLDADGAAFTQTSLLNGAAEQFLYLGIPANGLPAIAAVADSTGNVIGENGSSYGPLGRIVQGEDGSVAYAARVTTGAAVTDDRLGVMTLAGAYTFPVVTGTAVAGTGGGLTIGHAILVQPAPGGGWWLTGSVQAGGADLGFELPFLFRNGSLTSLFPGGTLAGIFGEDGLSTTIISIGGGLDGSLAVRIGFTPTNGGFRTALARRKADGTYRRIVEENTVATIDGAPRAVLSISQTTQPFTRDGALVFKVGLDGNQDVLLAARDTTALPVVTVTGRNPRTIRKRSAVVRGTASDDGTVRQVTYRVNKRPSLVANGTTSWDFKARHLKSGRNRVVILAVDGDGGSSAPARLVIRRR